MAIEKETIVYSLEAKYNDIERAVNILNSQFTTLGINIKKALSLSDPMTQGYKSMNLLMRDFNDAYNKTLTYSSMDIKGLNQKISLMAKLDQSFKDILAGEKYINNEERSRLASLDAIVISYDKQINRLRQLQTETSRYSQGWTIIGNSIDKLTTKRDELAKITSKEGLSATSQKEYRNELARTTTELDKHLKQEELLNKRGLDFRNNILLRAGAYTALYAVIFQGIQSVKSAIEYTVEYDKALRTNMAVLGINRNEAENLQNTLVNLSIQYGAVTKEVYDANLALGRAGIAVEKLAKATEIVIQLSLLTGDTLEASTNAIVSYSQVYNDIPLETLGDKLAYVANASRLSTRDINTFSGYALDASKAVGISLDAVNGMAIAFSNAGAGASTIGTQIRELSNIFRKGGENTEEFFGTLGLSQDILLTNLQKGTQESNETLIAFFQRLRDLSDTEYARITKSLGVRQKSVLDRIRNNFDSFNTAFKNSVRNVNGELDKSHEIIQAYERQWISSLNKIKAGFFDFFDVVVKEGVEVLGLVSDAFQKGGQEATSYRIELNGLINELIVLNRTQETLKSSGLEATQSYKDNADSIKVMTDRIKELQLAQKAFLTNKTFSDILGKGLVGLEKTNQNKSFFNIFGDMKQSESDFDRVKEIQSLFSDGILTKEDVDRITTLMDKMTTSLGKSLGKQAYEVANYGAVVKRVSGSIAELRQFEEDLKPNLTGFFTITTKDLQSLRAYKQSITDLEDSTSKYATTFRSNFNNIVNTKILKTMEGINGRFENSINDTNTLKNASNEQLSIVNDIGTVLYSNSSTLEKQAKLNDILNSEKLKEKGAYSEISDLIQKILRGLGDILQVEQITKDLNDSKLKMSEEEKNKLSLKKSYLESIASLEQEAFNANIKKASTLEEVSNQYNSQVEFVELLKQKELEASQIKDNELGTLAIKEARLEAEKDLRTVLFTLIKMGNAENEKALEIEKKRKSLLDDLEKRYFDATASRQAKLNKAKQEEIDKAVQLDIYTTEYAMMLDKVYENQEKLLSDNVWDGLDVAISDYMSKIPTLAEQTKSATESIIGTMESSMMDFFDITSNRFLDFGSLAENVLNQIMKKMIEMQVVNPLIEGIVGSIPSLLGGGSDLSFGYNSVIERKDGGLLSTRKYATGGLLTGGSGVRDDIYLGRIDNTQFLAMGGEYVVNKSATNSIGTSALDYINKTGTLPYVVSQDGSSNVVINIENNTTQDIMSDQISEIVRKNSKGEEERVINIVLSNVNNNPAFRSGLKSGLGY